MLILAYIEKMTLKHPPPVFPLRKLGAIIQNVPREWQTNGRLADVLIHFHSCFST